LELRIDAGLDRAAAARLTKEWIVCEWRPSMRELAFDGVPA
jgi:hypothetical protein